SLLLERIDLDHDPVDLVIELDPLLLPLVASLRHRRDRLVPLCIRVRAEPALAKSLQRVPMVADGYTVADAELVDPDRKGSLRRDRRFLLPQRSCCGLAWVRRRLLPPRDEPLVQGVEAAERQIDLTADFEERRRRLAARQTHAHRDRLDRLQVRRN